MNEATCWPCDVIGVQGNMWQGNTEMTIQECTQEARHEQELPWKWCTGGYSRRT